METGHERGKECEPNGPGDGTYLVCAHEGDDVGRLLHVTGVVVVEGFTFEVINLHEFG